MNGFVQSTITVLVSSNEIRLERYLASNNNIHTVILGKLRFLLAINLAGKVAESSQKL